MANSSARDEIIALEKSYWDAMKAKDGQRAAQLSGDPCVVTGMRGVMTIAKAKMAEMTAEGSWTLHSYAFDDVAVVTPAPNVAVIAYTVRQRVTMNGEDIVMHAADSSTWVRGDGGWQCHAHSETPLGDKKPE